MSAVALLQLSNGIVASALPLLMRDRGVGDSLVGVVLAATYAGLLGGTLLAPHLIARVGHRRAAAIAAALLGGAVIALHAESGLACLAARATAGGALAVLYVVLETWIARVGAQRSGAAIATYIITTYAALAVAPWLVAGDLGLGAAALLALATATPLLLVRAEAPTVKPVSAASPSAGRCVPAAIVAVASGATTAAYLALLPLYADATGASGALAALLMSAPLVLGLALQWPMGAIFDRPGHALTTRRLAIVTAGAALLALAPGSGRLLFAVVAGSLAFCFYPLALAIARRQSAEDERVAANAAVLRWWGVGAVLGPLVGGVAIEAAGPHALMAVIGVAAALPLLSGLRANRQVVLTW